MSRVCITNCMIDARTPFTRANYVRLQKFQEPDGEFVKAGEVYNTQMSPGESCGLLQPRVVDSISSRQIYLRSYKFSKEQSVPERTNKCLRKFRRRMGVGKMKAEGSIWTSMVKGKVRRKSSSASRFSAMFQKILSCSTSVDVMA